mmetsp:Transcript_102609/g.198865  ORF Transcript_102609/g.198865 Transcript_102609/m.198865 type:complete len:217 (-) Transcript_102609:162-812(-)
MSGFLADTYEDSDEDDNAPSILAKAAAEEERQGAGVVEEGVPEERNSAPTLTVASPLAAASPSASSSGEASPEQQSSDNAQQEGLLIPPSPPGQPDPEVHERAQALHNLRNKGKSIRDHIQGSRDWSNPYILERLIKIFELDQYGSNYPPDIFDPSRIVEHASDFYDAPDCERPPLPKRPKKNVDHGPRSRHRDGLRRHSSLRNATSPVQDTGRSP